MTVLQHNKDASAALSCLSWQANVGYSARVNVCELCACLRGKALSKKIMMPEATTTGKQRSHVSPGKEQYKGQRGVDHEHLQAKE